ncbi:hypothetical protein D3C87_1085270 [compost metagenome]
MATVGSVTEVCARIILAKPSTMPEAPPTGSKPRRAYSWESEATKPRPPGMESSSLATALPVSVKSRSGRITVGS